MIRFNIIGRGFLTLAEGTMVQFTRENIFYRFNDISFGRSVSFSVPATDANREVLGFAEDPNMAGETCRRLLDCEMQYDGGCDRGRIEVTGWSSKAFSCVYYIGMSSDSLTEALGRPLSECRLEPAFKAVVYGDTPIPASSATPARGNEILLYENGVLPAGTRLTPSVNLRRMVFNLLAGAGLCSDINRIHIPDDAWLIAGSVNGGPDEGLTLSQSSSTSSASVSPAVNSSLEIVDIDIESAETYIMGMYFGGTTLAAHGFKAKKDIKMTFGSSAPANLYLVQWSSRLGNCRTIGGADSFGNGDPHTASGEPSPPLAGLTVNIPKDAIFFFAANKFAGLVFNEWIYGYTEMADVSGLQVVASSDGELQPGEKWDIVNNMPDMTLFEFVRSSATACGMDVIWNGEEFAVLDHGNEDTVVTLGNVVSVESVDRCVGCWGDGTKVMTVRFDSADHVTQPISQTYPVQSERLSGEEESVIGFSEGIIGDRGVLVPDLEADNGSYKFVGKAWTIAKADPGANYLQRWELPDFTYCGQMGDSATRVVVTLAEDLHSFLSRKYDGWIIFKGWQYVWTDSVWSDGITTLTLQKL